MDIVYAFDVVGGPFDGAPGFQWLDDGKHPPPELIYVGVCRPGRDCGSSSCRLSASHVSFWLPEEDARPPTSLPYPKENEYVVTNPKTGEVTGRAIYAIGGLRDPQNFGDAARAPVELAGVGSEKMDPLVTAFGDPDDVLLSIIREAWAGAVP